MVKAIRAPEDVVPALYRFEVSKVLAGLQEEHEQEAVHHQDALFRELLRGEIVRRPFRGLPPGIGIRLEDRVAEKLNGLAHRIAQRFRDAKGVLVGVLVQLVRKRRRPVGRKRRFRQEADHRAERRPFAAVVDLVEIEDQRPAFGPLGLVRKKNRILAEDHDETRGVRRGEDLVGEQVLPRRHLVLGTVAADTIGEFTVRRLGDAVHRQLIRRQKVLENALVLVALQRTVVVVGLDQHRRDPAVLVRHDPGHGNRQVHALEKADSRRREDARIAQASGKFCDKDMQLFEIVLAVLRIRGRPMTVHKVSRRGNGVVFEPQLGNLLEGGLHLVRLADLLQLVVHQGREVMREVELVLVANAGKFSHLPSLTFRQTPRRSDNGDTRPGADAIRPSP